MPARPVAALPELFLPFLAPSFRPSLPRLSSSRRQISTPGEAYTARQGVCQCHTSVHKPSSGAELGSKRRLSRLAVRLRSETSQEDAYVPIASTSAVRLDSHLPAALPPLAPSSSSAPIRSAVPPPFINDDTERAFADFPSILRNLRSLSLEHPLDSPAAIISRARSQAYEGDRNDSPPTPPPPIVLHPQPYSTNSQFFTPLLLQGMILGASALGLFTRRKGRTKDGVMVGEQKSKHKTASELAEDRIDEVQALNLLIAAYTAPDLQIVEESSSDWRCTVLEPLVNLVSRSINSNQPLNRLGVASMLHFVSSSLPDSLKFQRARPLLAAQAHDAYQVLPVLAPTSSDFPLDLVTLSSFLSLVYPRDGSRTSRLFPTSPGGSGLDRSILESIASRILSSPSNFPPELLHCLGKAAARAKRIDIFEEVARASARLPILLRLDFVVAGLDLAASHQPWRRNRERVIPLAELFTSTVEGIEGLDKDGIDKLDRGIYLLRTAFSIDRPLEPFIAGATLATCSHSSHFDHRKYRTLLTDVLKHLSKSRNPSLARRIVESIPSHLVRLPHLFPLLSSSHPPTSQAAWDSLLSHPSLPLTSRAASHRFTSLSHRSAADPDTLRIAHRDFNSLKLRRVERTIETWNKYLHVVVRFGASNLSIERVVSSMAREGIEPNEWTRTILMQREMIRRDVQEREVRDRGGRGRRGEEPASEKPVIETRRVNRRGGGQAQMRNLREAMRVEEERVRQTAKPTKLDNGGGGGSKTLDIKPNLILKNLTRWTVECDIPRLVQLARVVVGIELDGSDSTEFRVGSSSRTSLAHAPRRSTPTESVLSMSKEEYNRIRVPAFRTLISAFERRGSVDLAKELRRAFKEEKCEVERVRSWKKRETSE